MRKPCKPPKNLYNEYCSCLTLYVFSVRDHVRRLITLFIEVPSIIFWVFSILHWSYIRDQARSSLYANTQLRAHRRAEKNKEQKTKKKQNKE
jgi:hypothetical protein